MRAAAAEAPPAGPAVARLLVVKLADLGDALTATPALRALRQTWPDATIDVLTTPIGAAALDGLDSVEGREEGTKGLLDQLGSYLTLSR